LAPPEIDELQRRLQGRGSDDEATIQKKLEIAQQELVLANAEGVHDRVIVNDDLETAFKQLENYIFGIEESVEEPSQFVSSDEKAQLVEHTNVEAEMVDPGAPAPEDFPKTSHSGADDVRAAAREPKTAEGAATT
jgi:THO complex subunit 1